MDLWFFHYDQPWYHVSGAKDTLGSKCWTPVPAKVCLLGACERYPRMWDPFLEVLRSLLILLSVVTLKLVGLSYS